MEVVEGGHDLCGVEEGGRVRELSRAGCDQKGHEGDRDKKV